MHDGSDASIVPLIEFGENGESAFLSEKSVEMVANGITWTGTAEVKLDLSPHPNIYFYCRLELKNPTVSRENILSIPLESEISVDGKILNGFFTEANFLSIEPPIFSGKWCPNSDTILDIGDNATQMKNILLHLFNLDFIGWPRSKEQDGNLTRAIEQIDLESAAITVTIWSLYSTHETRKNLRQRGGCHLTHIAEVKEKNGNLFSAEDAKKMLEALKYFLSFAEGNMCIPACPSGHDASGNVVWSQWSSPRTTGQNSLSWFDRQDPQPLESLFSGFMKRWENNNWREALKDAIWWYVNANSTSLGIDVGIIISQTAIERLSYEYCVCEKILIRKGGFKALHAQDQYRLLLSSLEIPLEIPSCATTLLSKGKEINWKDGPDALTEIRNNLVHGGMKRDKYSFECYVEAWKLKLWYIEMILLALCEYNGKHWNRNNGTVEDVPWQIPACDFPAARHD